MTHSTFERTKDASLPNVFNIIDTVQPCGFFQLPGYLVAVWRGSSSAIPGRAVLIPNVGEIVIQSSGGASDLGSLFRVRHESGARRLDLLELRQICGILGISLVNLIKRFEKLVR
jgi:hypothetical protein